MSSKIEQVIGEIEDYIADCKYATFSNTNILVDKDRIDELLRDLRKRTPEEIKIYQKIISHKEAIFRDAREKADAMLSMAQAETDRMVEENEIMQQAYAQAAEVVKQAMDQAQQIVDAATIEANNVKQSAMEYTFSQLSTLQDIISHSINTAETKYNDLIMQLKGCESIISKNRSELYPSVELENAIAAVEGPINNVSSDSSDKNPGGSDIAEASHNTDI